MNVTAIMTDGFASWSWRYFCDPKSATNYISSAGPIGNLIDRDQ